MDAGLIVIILMFWISVGGTFYVMDAYWIDPYRYNKIRFNSKFNIVGKIIIFIISFPLLLIMKIMYLFYALLTWHPLDKSKK